ncbi:hypothetical protein P4493_11025 [Bacillus thuringiensis]|nr:MULTISPECIES: hypothetical protein [Bacillus]AJH02364.1 hypothetical protein AS86_6716 [Bacillus thuringiensis HD1002]EXL36685.1 hypothetical protein BG78_22915 [Bacillus thuringiensis serovar israelensis]MCC4009716.1 hypothetical protein [Bacillus thuringiensis]MCC4029092.1 hypothetical protein [Bacillus thuringiensis]MCR6819938.1 hypothetical protein [Bacillus thuringiensis]
MVKLARGTAVKVDFVKNSVTGHTKKKVRGAMVNRIKMDRFERGFPDGVYVEPSDKKEPRIKVKALFEYCNERGVKPKDLTDEEREQFLVYE